MTLNLNLPTAGSELKPRITVIGVGGAGGNAVNNMIQGNLEGVEFLIANTDSQALKQSLCSSTIQLGRHVTQGLGAGSRPDVGRAAAEEAMDEILSHIEGANMLFITAGMGGGTGTGAAPVIARAAREAGLLTVGVVTKPFHFEGVHRMRIAENGINDLAEYVDTLIIIPNQNLFRIANEKTTFADAFKMADNVLNSGVRGVTDLMVNPGLINLDFADIRSVMSEMGKAMMGTGEATGDNRAIEAAEAAISNPLLDDVSMKGARGVLINITGGPDLTLFEVDEAANRIRDEVDPEANIIFGSTFDPALEGSMRVSVVATGIDVDAAASPRPVTLSVVGGQASARPLGGGSRSEPAAPDPAEAPAMAEAERLTAGSDLDLPAPEAEAGSAAQATGDAEAEPLDERARAEADAFIPPAPVEPNPAAESGAASRRQPDPFAAAAMANAVRPTGGSQATGSPDGSEKTAPRRAGQGLFARMADGAARAIKAAHHGEGARGGYAQPTGHGGQGAVAGTQRPTPTLRTTASAQLAEPFESPMAQLTYPEPAPEPAASEPAARQAEPVGPSPAPRLDPVAGPARERPAPEPRPAAARPDADAAQPGAPRAAAQPRLTGLDARERITAHQSEEDLLDIPAFLRRQAN